MNCSNNFRSMRNAYHFLGLSLLAASALVMSPAGVLNAQAPTEVEMTRVGDPIWRLTGIHRFSGVATPMEAGLEFVYSLVPLDRPFAPDFHVPHDPPYDSEWADALAANGLEDRVRFTAEDIEGRPRGIYTVFTIIPDPGVTGSSYDFDAGPIIPNSLGLTFHAEFLLDGTLVEEADGAFPPATGKDGYSHLSTGAVWFHPFVLDPDAGPFGNYENRLSFRDAEGNGWDVTVPFQVVPTAGQDDEQVITRLARFEEVRAANGTTAEVVLELDEPVDLEGIRQVFLDGIRVGKDTAAPATTEIGFGLFEDGVRFQNYPLSRVWEDAQIVTFPLRRKLSVDHEDRTVDAIELKLRLSTSADAWIRPYPETGGVRVHFIRGNDPLSAFQRGNNQTRRLPAVAAQSVVGTDETDWHEYFFDDFGLDPVEGYGLKYVFNSNLGISGSVPSATTIAELMLDDDSTLRLNDSFMPSQGEPRPGELNSANFRLLDREQRLALDGKEVVGWRWKIIKTGPGSFTAHSTGGAVRIEFFYDFSEIEDTRPAFLRGDCNEDGAVNISDATCILNWLFAGQADPGCVAATNTNGDDNATITDATYLLNHLFSGGPAPAAPFPDCGPGALPADQELGCANPPDCQ